MSNHPKPLISIEITNWYPAAAARVLDGKAIALEWENSIAAEAAQLSKELRRKPGLAVIIAGSRPDSAIYVQRKQDACKRVRMFVTGRPTATVSSPRGCTPAAEAVISIKGSWLHRSSRDSKG